LKRFLYENGLEVDLMVTDAQASADTNYLI